jgi:adenosylcobinamide-GDP ribazoletransferase
VPGRAQGIRRPWADCAGAVAFLTIVPVPRRLTADFDLGATLPWFPLVGAALGAFAGAIRLLTGPLWGRGPSTAVGVVVLVMITGALHQDALADTADGLGVRGDRQRRLEVMRDSRVGAFGVVALVLWGLLLFSAIDAFSRSHGLIALTCACACARAAAVVHARLAPPARTDGLGVQVGATFPRAVIAVALASAISAAVAGPARGGLCAIALLGIGAISAFGARRAVGGSTGDTLGATIAVGEIVMCLALLATW